MKRIITATLLTSLLLGTTWTQAEARPRPRKVYCHYQTADGRRGWSPYDVRLTIRCAANKYDDVSVAHALYVADRESNFIATATNSSSGACGIMQHLPTYWPGRRASYLRVHPYWSLGASCYNARSNVVAAMWMVHKYGWSPWGG